MVSYHVVVVKVAAGIDDSWGGALEGLFEMVGLTLEEDVHVVIGGSDLHQFHGDLSAGLTDSKWN